MIFQEMPTNCAISSLMPTTNPSRLKSTVFKKWIVLVVQNARKTSS